MKHSIAAVVVMGALGLGACAGPQGPAGVAGPTGQTGRTSMDRVIVTSPRAVTTTTETVIPARVPAHRSRTTTWSDGSTTYSP